ncbi:cuticle protein 10.9 [Nephila pilipes]|uniref:Cuticle protein 10.9 n=1 Tax=Nephila pilipes TaxID=299642 RepID=A0A8X6KJ26_NEPPI|nr:cuticle protein 10.9 [Nephila pilipes]
MLFVALIALAVAAANAQGPLPDYRIRPYYDETPKPYAFSYNAPLDDGVGQSSRSESADGSGRVQGSYTLNNDEGHFRVVEYVADQDGFRAAIRTNEPGTESKNPADVIMNSEAGPIPYAPGIRRPILNAAVNPVVPVVAPGLEPAVVPEPILRRPPYRRPYSYRPLNRYPY